MSKSTSTSVTNTTPVVTGQDRPDHAERHERDARAGPAAAGTNGQLGVERDAGRAAAGDHADDRLPEDDDAARATRSTASTTSSDIPPGTVKRLSVSVLLDSAVVKPADVATIWQPNILAAAGIEPSATAPTR